MPLGSDARPANSLKELQEVRLLHSQYGENFSYQSRPENERLQELKGDKFEEGQIVKVRHQPRVGKALWDQPPQWLRIVYSGNGGLHWARHTHGHKGDRSLLETLANVATSMPFLLIGLQAPRKKQATKLYANSVIGVGVASSLYHTSRGKIRRYFRWGDYAMIATSTLCLSSALRTEKYNPKALMLASAMMIPFQPMLVTALHTGLMEATFAMKVAEEPRLRKAHSLHTVSSLIGGALFVADDVFPNMPYVHAAWHVAAAVGVAALNTLLE